MSNDAERPEDLPDAGGETEEVTPADIERARAWARRNLRRGDGGLEDPWALLDARKDDEEGGSL